MTVGMSEYTVDKLFNLLFNAAAWTAPTSTYLKLHLGDPGAAGTANPASHTTRYAVQMGTPAAPAGGTITILNDVALNITDLIATGTEDATHYSLWDTAGPTGGNFLGSGVLNANPYIAGEMMTFAVGTVSLSMPCAT